MTPPLPAPFCARRPADFLRGLASGISVQDPAFDMDLNPL
ncbi:hypothetical protein ATI53_10673 [Salipiger aestuarii]|uniref:Uncharacterized protein n=1 Tax=Salipiger aestuarii TaxID=568098 RepID=A0A327XNF4_9RHOB|nr:hypothetical protein ATI53_10673 [Salipiger aestuarii]